MRSKYTTKHLMSVFFCTTGLVYSGQAIGQNEEAQAPAGEVQLFNQDEAPANQQVEVGETGDIDLHVKDLEITKVLQLLSIQSQRNIIASREVAGKVSADLYGVDFTEALDAILMPNGYRWIEEGNFIYVITQAEYDKRDQANRPVITRIYRLNYLRSDDAAKFVTPMLSDKGTITASGNVEDGFQADVSKGGSNEYAGSPTLVLRDYEDKIDEITSILQQLDVQPKQVIIEATILKATLTEQNAFGVDFALFSNLNNANPLSAVGDLIGGVAGGSRDGAISSNVGNTAPGINEGVKLGFVAGDAAVFVRALDQVTDTTLIATPKTTVLDRNRADILVGQKIAYLSTTVTETSETQTVEFLEVGTQLSVRPFVSDDGKVRLELRPSVSDATIRTIGTTSAPDEETVELITNVIVESGQTIVLGGLFTDDSQVDRNQVPGLGNIKGIGKAFQGHDNDVSRSEVIFLVKATVVDNQTLVNLGAEGQARVDVAAVAERQQLLPWSRSKLTASHLINARTLHDEAQGLTGAEREDKLAQALYCVDMALHLNPSMVDALLLKQEITGKQESVYLESIVDQTYKSVLDQEMKGLDLPELPEAEPQGAAQPEANDPVADALNEEAQAAEQPAMDEAQIADANLDHIWLESMLQAEQPQPAEQPEPEFIEIEEPAQEPQVSEVQTVGSAAPATEYEDVQPVEIEAVEIEPVEIEEEYASYETQPLTSKIFGFSWRSLSTAQLLQLAAQATEDTQPIDAAQAEVETDTQWQQGK